MNRPAPTLLQTGPWPLLLTLIMLATTTPTAVQAQAALVRVRVEQNDGVADGKLVAVIEAMTKGLEPNNTLSYANIELNYDAAHLTYVGDEVRSIKREDGYTTSIDVLKDENSVYLQLLITSEGISPKALPGHDIGEKYEPLRAFTFVINKAGVEAGTTDLIIRPLTLKVGFYDSPQNNQNTNESVPAPIGQVEDELKIPLGILPVELAAFDAAVDGTDVRLAWRTASETNNAGFQVQMRPADGAEESTQSWSALGFVEGAGTTSQGQAYTFHVPALAPGSYAFRLKQVDFDGGTSYSAEREVQVTLAHRFVLEEAYPNPFNPTATIGFAVRVAEPVEVALFNVLGQRVQTLYAGTPEAHRRYEVRIDGAGLPGGVYLVHLRGASFTATRMVTLVK